jgi:hypothetical protein
MLMMKDLDMVDNKILAYSYLDCYHNIIWLKVNGAIVNVDWFS